VLFGRRLGLSGSVSQKNVMIKLFQGEGSGYEGSVK
jgi:hypothetical protein